MRSSLQRPALLRATAAGQPPVVPLTAARGQTGLAFTYTADRSGGRSLGTDAIGRVSR
jgi:hypothetical protein